MNSPYCDEVRRLVVCARDIHLLNLLHSGGKRSGERPVSEALFDKLSPFRSGQFQALNLPYVTWWVS
jgi:hypothetical protein